MPTDYRDAAERHWEDANHLLTDSRLANADHLMGLAAECALKAVMQGLGMGLRPDGAPHERRHRVHIDGVWVEFSAFASGRGGAKYSALLGNSANPFTGWDVNQRYNHRSDFLPAAVEAHRQATEATMKALQAAILDGCVP